MALLLKAEATDPLVKVVYKCNTPIYQQKRRKQCISGHLLDARMATNVVLSTQPDFLSSVIIFLGHFTGLSPPSLFAEHFGPLMTKRKVGN